MGNADPDPQALKCTKFYEPTLFSVYIWIIKIVFFVTFQSGLDPDSHGSALVLLPQSGSVSAFSEKDPSGFALKNMRIHNTDLMPASILETLEPSPSSGYTDESQPESHSVH